jgi:hypothetical protein
MGSVRDRVDVALPSCSFSCSIPNRTRYEPSDLRKQVNEVGPAMALVHSASTRTITSTMGEEDRSNARRRERSFPINPMSDKLASGMSTVDIYVQVTATPYDVSGHPSDSPIMVVVEIPAARIERYREQSPNRSEATDAQLAENLGGEIGPRALTRIGLHSPVRWFVESVALPQRPPEVEVRPPDFSYDGMKAWIPTRQSFV